MMPMGVENEDGESGKESTSLFLGTSDHASDSKMLTDLGITHIVNCTKDIPNKFEKRNPRGLQLCYHRIPIDDLENEPIDLYFHSSSQFIAGALKEKDTAKVLVHCVSSKASRAASIIIAFLISHKRLGFKAAHDLVKNKSSNIHLNVGFAYHLKKLEIETFEKGSLSDEDIPKYYVDGKKLEKFEADNFTSALSKLKNGIIRTRNS